MSEKRFEVMIENNIEIGKKPKSACILDKKEEKVYLLAIFTRRDSKESVKTYIEQLYEVTNLLNELSGDGV